MAEDWDAQADVYESKWEDVTGYFVPHLVDWANPRRRGFVVVDVGCGPGVVTMAMAERGARVIGVDVSDRMVARLLQRATAAGFAAQVEGLVASGEALALPERAAHSCVSNFGIIYCPDVDAALHEMFRVTTGGGPLMITAWTASKVNGWHSLLPDGYEAALGFTVPPRSNVRWSSLDELRAALEKAQWNDVQIDTLAAKPSVMPSAEAVRDAFETPPSKETLASLGPEKAARLIDFVVDQARQRFGDGEVELPREAWIARGRA